jgi:uncharacterized coiled-coil protein SlyX
VSERLETAQPEERRPPEDERPPHY